jgi:hypothetical protein
MTLHYVYVEYCPGNLFWGWWFYAAPMVNGKPDRERATWLNRADWAITDLMRLAGLPAALIDYRTRNSDFGRASDAFMAAHPDGMFAEMMEGTYRLAAVAEPGDAELWCCAKAVREAQLLDWKDVARRKEDCGLWVTSRQ